MQESMILKDQKKYNNTKVTAIKGIFLPKIKEFKYFIMSNGEISKGVKYFQVLVF
jgi:hypothetical protein